MDPITITVLCVVLLFILLFLRVPIAACLLFVGILGIFLTNGFRFGEFNAQFGWNSVATILSRDTYSFVASFSLMAVPMFLLMGNLAFHADVTGEAYNSARVWVGRWPGGLALSTIAACGLFAAVSGSSLATAAAMGRIAAPEMLRQGYDKGLTAGTIAAGGTLGALIPPSVLMIIYGVFAEVSIGRLLIAGIVPGMLTGIFYAVMIAVRVRATPELAPRYETRHDFREKLRSLGGTWQFLVLFMVVMGSIYAGVTTPTEAAALGAAGMFGLGWARRKLNLAKTHKAIIETLIQTSMIFVIAIGANAFANFIAFTGIMSALATWVGSLDVAPIIVILALCGVLVVLGMFVDPIGIMLLTLPVTLPIVSALGYDLIWFGVILVKFLEIGMITPPVGLNVFVLKGVLGDTIPLDIMFRGIMWFLAADAVTVAILLTLPDFVLWLPGLVTHN